MPPDVEASRGRFVVRTNRTTGRIIATDSINFKVCDAELLPLVALSLLSCPVGKALIDIIDTIEAGKVLGVKRRQVLNLITSGILPAVRLGNAYAIRRADLAKVPTVRKPGPKPKRGR